MSPTSRRHHQRICGCNKPLRPPAHSLPVSSEAIPTICPEIIDIIIDFLHDDKHTLRTCALVCKSWLPASRYHLFHSISIFSHNASAFRRLLCCRHSTLPSSIVHLQVGLAGHQLWIPPVNFIPHARALRSLSLHCQLRHNTLPRCLDGFKTITVLKIISFHIPTCATLLQILAAAPLLETATLSDIEWETVGNVPDPQSFPYLHTLSTHCKASSHILDWLSKRPLPVLRSVSIRADSSVAGCQFLRTLRSSLQYLRVEMCIERIAATHTYRQGDEIMFFNSVDLSSHTNLRSITIDISFSYWPFEVDIFPMLSMLFRTHLSCLDTISLTLTSTPHHLGLNAAPWNQLARSVIAHLNSLRSLNIILPGIYLTPRTGRRSKIHEHEAKRRDRIVETLKQEIISELSGVRVGGKALLAITNISFPPAFSSNY